MAKDAKGHGSEARGAAAAHQEGVEAASRGQFTASQIEQLKAGYAGIKTVDPSQPTYGKLTALLDRATPEQLKQLAGAGIKFVSPLASNRSGLRSAYGRNENANRQSENVVLLAKHFGTDEEHAKAREIVSERNRQGSLPMSTKSVSDVRAFQHDINTRYSPKLRG